MVDMSRHSEPGSSASAAPPSPRSTDSTSGASTTIVTTALAPSAASAGVAAARTPCSSANRSALPSLCVHTDTSKPARARFAAMGPPMIPSPQKATRSA